MDSWGMCGTFFCLVQPHLLPTVIDYLGGLDSKARTSGALWLLLLLLLLLLLVLLVLLVLLLLVVVVVVVPL